MAGFRQHFGSKCFIYSTFRSAKNKVIGLFFYSFVSKNSGFDLITIRADKEADIIRVQSKIVIYRKTFKRILGY